MGSNLASQTKEIKARYRPQQGATQHQPQGSAASVRSSSPERLDDRHTTTERIRSRAGRRTIRVTPFPNRPLLDEIERQEQSELLIAILNEYRSRRASDGGDNEREPNDG